MIELSCEYLAVEAKRPPLLGTRQRGSRKDGGGHHCVLQLLTGGEARLLLTEGGDGVPYGPEHVHHSELVSGDQPPWHQGGGEQGSHQDGEQVGPAHHQVVHGINYQD